MTITSITSFNQLIQLHPKRKEFTFILDNYTLIYPKVCPNLGDILELKIINAPGLQNVLPEFIYKKLEIILNFEPHIVQVADKAHCNSQEWWLFPKNTFKAAYPISEIALADLLNSMPEELF